MEERQFDELLRRVEEAVDNHAFLTRQDHQGRDYLARLIVERDACRAEILVRNISVAGDRARAMQPIFGTGNSCDDAVQDLILKLDFWAGVLR